MVVRNLSERTSSAKKLVGGGKEFERTCFPAVEKRWRVRLTMTVRLRLHERLGRQDLRGDVLRTVVDVIGKKCIPRYCSERPKRKANKTGHE